MEYSGGTKLLTMDLDLSYNSKEVRKLNGRVGGDRETLGIEMNIILSCQLQMAASEKNHHRLC